MTDLYQPERQDIELGAVLAALSDPVRLQMVAAMHEGGPAACTTFGPAMAKSTRSHHLKVLREAGVTQTKISGVERIVGLRYDCLNERFPGLLESVLNAAVSPKKRRE